MVVGVYIVHKYKHAYINTYIYLFIYLFRLVVLACLHVYVCGMTWIILTLNSLTLHLKP